MSTVVAALCGCSAGDNDEKVVSGECEATGVATKMGGVLEHIDFNESFEFDDAMTRSIFFGGSNGVRFFQVWDELDEPMVYRGSSYLGTFKPKEKGVSTTTLSGSLTGSFKVGDNLTIYSPSPICDFTDQDGTIASMSADHSFMTATATVASVSGSNITTSAMKFNSFAAYLSFTFTDENNHLLHVKKLTITTAERKEDGTLAETMNLITGVNTMTNEYVINTPNEKNTDDYPTNIRIVIYDLGKVKSSFTFTVLASDGKTYQLKNALSYLFNVGGKAFTVKYQMPCIDVEAGVSTGITPPTDEDVQIDDVVKE